MWEISANFFKRGVSFCWCPLLWNICTLSSQPVPYCVDKFAFLGSSSRTSRVFWAVKCHLAPVICLLIAPTFNSGSTIFVCFFTALSPLLANFLFWWLILVKRYLDLPLRYKKATQPHTLLSLRELNSRSVVTHHQQTLREMRWLVTDKYANWLCNHLWTEV